MNELRKALLRYFDHMRQDADEWSTDTDLDEGKAAGYRQAVDEIERVLTTFSAFFTPEGDDAAK
jgi:hypothetical protein